VRIVNKNSNPSIISNASALPPPAGKRKEKPRTNTGASGGRTTTPGCPHRRNSVRDTARKRNAVFYAANPYGTGSG